MVVQTAEQLAARLAVRKVEMWVVRKVFHSAALKVGKMVELMVDCWVVVTAG